MKALTYSPTEPLLPGHCSGQREELKFLLKNGPELTHPPGVKCLESSLSVSGPFPSNSFPWLLCLSLTHIHTHLQLGPLGSAEAAAEPFFSFLSPVRLVFMSIILSLSSIPVAYLPHKRAFPAGPLNVQTWALKDQICLGCYLPNLAVSLLPLLGGGGGAGRCFPGLSPLGLRYRQLMVEGAVGRHIMSDALGFLRAFCQRQGSFRC